MRWNKHFELEGRHAFLSPSSYSWARYDDEKLKTRYYSAQAKIRGTELHDIAARLIKAGIKLPEDNTTLSMYVNDGIDFNMRVEQPLKYSDVCFGHCDTISFANKNLRIHDYKSGETPASMDQLYIYAALFCLEYSVDPRSIETELRIYQSDAIVVSNPEPEEIIYFMELIKHDDEIIESLKEQEE